MAMCGWASPINSATIDRGFSMIAGVPELKSKPIVIGESDPDGCAACQGPQLGYRNTTMYSSYTAASFARKHDLAERHGVNLEAALTWAFEFEDQPFFAGQRVLANNGIDLPVLNVFRMFSKMGGQRVEAKSSGQVPLDSIIQGGVRAAPDVAALASLEAGNSACWSGITTTTMCPARTPQSSWRSTACRSRVETATLTQYRIDADHSNAFTVWKRMGSPTAPNDAQYAQLVKAGQLAQFGKAETLEREGGQGVRESEPAAPGRFPAGPELGIPALQRQGPDRLEGRRARRRTPTRPRPTRLSCATACSSAWASREGI